MQRIQRLQVDAKVGPPRSRGLLVRMHPQSIDVIAGALFAAALLHTFAAKRIQRLSRSFPRHAGLFHLLGEVEVIFGFWALILIATMAMLFGADRAIDYAESRNFTEPLFVFVIMVVAGSRPVLSAVLSVVLIVERVVPLPNPMARAWIGLTAIPLMGSLVTEPAAMTIAAMLLAPVAFRRDMPEAPKYFALAVLFVNVSIGGTLTPFAAPPVLMVAAPWGWSGGFMAGVFGWKAAAAVIVNASAATFLLRTFLAAGPPGEEQALKARVPWTVIAVHLGLLSAIVVMAHHKVVFMGLFLLFLGIAHAYEKYQTPLLVREALLVAFFLAGLVVLGGLQRWWLEPLVSDLGAFELFLGAVALTAIVDNAALTHLGSQIADLSELAKYMLVAGAVAGGGLTVIANAPNPAGIALLKKGFADESVGAGALLLAALLPTAVAAAAFLIL
ncbi:MAG TPA: putative Na+/H+ antiporter [Steroidobacteraceae bacterium]